jgi:hypothetical protein
MRLVAQDPKDERNPHRILIVGNSRGGDPFRYLLKLNPDTQWLESGCLEYLGEIGDEGASDTKAMLDKVIDFLNGNRGKCYAATELHNLLGGNMDTLFKALSKGVKMELISRRKEAREFSRVRGRRPWLYFLPDSDGDGDNPGGSGSPDSGFSLQTTHTTQNPIQKIDDDIWNVDPVSDRISGTISGTSETISGSEGIPEKESPIPEIQKADIASTSELEFNNAGRGEGIREKLQTTEPAIARRRPQQPTPVQQLAATEPMLETLALEPQESKAIAPNQAQQPAPKIGDTVVAPDGQRGIVGMIYPDGQLGVEFEIEPLRPNSASYGLRFEWH